MLELLSPLRPLVVLCAACLPAFAQALLPIGRRSLQIVTQGAGTTPLPCTFYYPGVQTGDDVPLRARPGGYPVLVFLHGFEKFGRDYVEIGAHWAARGYVVCLHDSAWNDLQLQITDALAVPAALLRENASTSSPFHGQLRMGELILLGHSTGAANVAHVLARNPGYRAGIAYGPWRGFDLQYTKDVGPKVDVPMLVIGGKGEKITPWEPHVRGFFDELQQAGPLRVLCVFDQDVNHYNVVAWVLGQPLDRAVFEETQDKVQSFCEYVLEQESTSLEPLLGRSGRSSGRTLVTLQHCEAPLLWRLGSTRIGARAGFEHLAEIGDAIWLVSLGNAAIATPWGTLRVSPLTMGVLFVDPVGPTGHRSLSFALPNDPLLVGLEFCFQTFGQGTRGPRLSNAALLRFTP